MQKLLKISAFCYKVVCLLANDALNNCDEIADILYFFSDYMKNLHHDSDYVILFHCVEYHQLTANRKLTHFSVP